MSNRCEVAGHDDQPRSSFVIELGEQGADRPYFRACKMIEKRRQRREKIRALHYPEAVETYRREQQEFAQAAATLMGENRTPSQRHADVETEEMKQAEQQIPELSRHLTEARERVEELEEEYEHLGRWLSQNAISTAERRTRFPSLPDRDELARERAGPRPPSRYLEISRM